MHACRAIGRRLEGRKVTVTNTPCLSVQPQNVHLPLTSSLVLCVVPKSPPLLLSFPVSTNAMSHRQVLSPKWRNGQPGIQVSPNGAKLWRRIKKHHTMPPTFPKCHAMLCHAQQTEEGKRGEECCLNPVHPCYSILPSSPTVLSTGACRQEWRYRRGKSSKEGERRERLRRVGAVGREERGV